MTEHDAAEQAYKNGYEKGYADGKSELGEWIRVEEKLPKLMKPVLVCVNGYLKNPIVVVSEMLEENGTRWSACAGFAVTHWMPLPKPPRESDSE